MNDEFMIPQQYDSKVTPQDVYTSEMVEDKLKNILSQINPVNQIDEIELRLRGYKKNFYTGQWEKAFNGLDNELIISRYVSWLSSVLHIGVPLGNLSTQQINKIMHQSIRWVVDDLDAHAEDYNINDDYTERSRIADIMLNSLFFTLKRSENGAEARRFWGSFSLSESNNPGFNNKGNGSDWWKFWRK